MGFLLIVLLLVGLYVIQGYAQNRGLKWIFVAFSVVLVGTTVVYYLLPDPEGNQNNWMTEQEDLETRDSQFFNAALNGNIEKIEGVNLVKEWSFEFDEDMLEIPETGSSPLPLIIIDPKQTEDGKIEVLNYATKMMLGDLDISEKIGESQVTLTNNHQLLIYPPEPFTFKVVGFKKDYILSQFDLNQRNLDYFTLNFESYEEVLYVRIPPNVQVVESQRFPFVGDN